MRGPKITHVTRGKSADKHFYRVLQRATNLAVELVTWTFDRSPVPKDLYQYEATPVILSSYIDPPFRVA